MNLLNKRTILVRNNNSSSKQQKQRKYCRTLSIKIGLSLIVAIVALTAWVHYRFLFRHDHDGHYLHDNDPSLLSDPPLPPLHRTPPRYVTVILPSVVNPTRRRKRLEAIAKTWGPAARAIYILHSQDEYDIDIGIDAHDAYPQTMLLPESITVKDGVPRLEYVLQTILQKYDPDFTFFVNDHTYILPHNACKFLRGRTPEHHLYAGHALSNSQKLAFNSGAAGYFLSRASLSGLVERWTAGEEHCSMGGAKGEKASKWLQGNPGLVTAECLGKAMGVGPVDTRDEVGRHLFHAYGMVRTVKGSVDKWYMDKHRLLDEVLSADPLYHHQPRSGEQSPDTISFHYVESAETVALTDTLNKIYMAEKSSSGKTLANDELKDYMRSIWPTDVGGYSQQLPPVTELDTWENLLLTVRNMSLGVMVTPCFA